MSITAKENLNFFHFAEIALVLSFIKRKHQSVSLGKQISDMCLDACLERGTSFDGIFLFSRVSMETDLNGCSDAIMLPSGRLKWE